MRNGVTVEELVEAELRESMTDLEVRLLSEGYVPEFVGKEGSSGWHRPTMPVPQRSTSSIIAGIVIIVAGILGLVVLVRGWPA